MSEFGEQEYAGSSQDPPCSIEGAFPSSVLLWNVIKDDDASIWGEVCISTRDTQSCPVMSDPTYIWGYSGEHRMIEAIVYLTRQGIQYTIVQDDSEDFKSFGVSDGWSDY